MKERAAHLDAVGSVVEALDGLGLPPVLVGGMAPGFGLLLAVDPGTATRIDNGPGVSNLGMIWGFAENEEPRGFPGFP